MCGTELTFARGPPGPVGFTANYARLLASPLARERHLYHWRASSLREHLGGEKSKSDSQGLFGKSNHWCDTYDSNDSEIVCGLRRKGHRPETLQKPTARPLASITPSRSPSQAFG